MSSSAALSRFSMSEEKLGVTLSILAATGFSMKAIFVKLAYAQGPIDPVVVLSLRMLFSLPLFLWLGYRTLNTGAALQGKDWIWLCVLGLLGYYGASILDFIGLQYISTGLERLILFTYPTLTLLIGVLFMGHQLTQRQVGAILLSYLGIGLAFAHDLDMSGDSDKLMLGAGFVFASALSYALYTTGAERMVHRIGSMRFAVLATLVSTLASQIHFVAQQPLSDWVQPLPVYGYCAAMAVFSTVLPVVWQSMSIRMIGSARASMIGTLGPVLTIFFGWVLLSEPVSTEQMLGAALVLSGVYLVSKKSQKSQTEG